MPPWLSVVILGARALFRNPFDGARAKIERSHRHFQELAREDVAYSQSQEVAIDLVVQPNGDTKGYARIARVPTLAHASIVSDIVGALRSSLDLAVCAACHARGAVDVSNTYFAFAGSERDWDLNVHRRMKNADSAVRNAVRSFQPWKENGDVLLYALSKLAANDKHVKLLGLGSGPGDMKIEGLRLEGGDGKPVRYQGRVPVWRDGEPAELFTISAPAKVEITGPCVVEARFGLGLQHGLPLLTAIDALYRMGSKCEGIIDLLERVSEESH